MSEKKLIISGFGTVGRSLVREILKRRPFNALNIVALVDSKGAAVNKSGFTTDTLIELLKTSRGGLSKHPKYGFPGFDTKSVMEMIEADVLVELTPSNYRTEEPGVSNVLKAIDLGLDIVLANKSPIALLGLDLLKKAKSSGVKILYRATVMGGTPLIPLVKSIKDSVKRIYGVLNATTNYILTLMYEYNETFENALFRAQREGIAEADPSLDIDGLDVAAKLSILACSLNYNLKISNVIRESLRNISLEEVINKKKEDKIPKIYS